MAGRQIGPYKVLSTLDEGSDEHRVLLTQRAGIERLFALKLFRPNLPTDRLERYQRGAHLAAKVDHPYVVRPIEVGRTPEGSLYVVSEHVLGESLRACLERQGRYHWREAANLVADAAEGVQAAHRVGLVHRDISPERLIFNRKSGHAMVLDFGLARDTLEPSRLSKTGELIGSLVYMAPEQLAGQRAESPCDVYALATLLYELIAGELPYLGRDLEELRQKVTAGQRLDLRKHVPEVPRELVELLDRAMSTDPRRRPPANVFAQSLRDLGSVETAIPTAVLHARERGLRPGLVGASFALWFLVLGGVAAWGISTHGQLREVEAQRAEQAAALEAKAREVLTAHEERAEALADLNRFSGQLSAAREESRRAALEGAEAKRRAERLEHQANLDKDTIRSLEVRLTQAGKALQSLQERGAQEPEPSAGADVVASTRAFLDWTARELQGVPGGQFLRAKILHNRGRYAQALEALGTPSELPHKVLRARTLYKLGRIQEAQEAFDAVAAEAPDSPQGLFCRGVRSEDPAQRLELIRRAVQAAPKLAYLRIMLTDLLSGEALRTREVNPAREGLAAIEEAIRLEPTSYQIFETRAEALMVLGSLERNQARFREALLDIQRARVFFASPGSFQRAGEAYRALRQPKRALEELQRGVIEADALGAALPRVQLRITLGSTALAFKDRALAVRAFREAAQVDPALAPQVAQVFRQFPSDLRREVLEGLPSELQAKLGQ